jgi:hypothetical protein
VPDGVNPAVKAVEPSRFDPAGQALAEDAGTCQLLAGDDSVLTSRQPSNQFLTHVRE